MSDDTHALRCAECDEPFDWMDKMLDVGESCETRFVHDRCAPQRADPQRRSRPNPEAGSDA